MVVVCVVCVPVLLAAVVKVTVVVVGVGGGCCESLRVLLIGRVYINWVAAHYYCRYTINST